MSVAQLTDANFESEVLGASTPVLVDVWAAWCGPCRLMAPLMDWAASAYTGRLAVGKLENNQLEPNQEPIALPAENGPAPQLEPVKVAEVDAELEELKRSIDQL